MTRHSNQTTPSKLNILKQLEYCRLDRAAELLREGANKSLI